MDNAANMILYRNLEQGQILANMTWIMEQYISGSYKQNREDVLSLCYESLHDLIELSASHGFEGNLWHNYLTYLMVNNENAYSTACEIRGSVSGSINDLARHDFTIFKELFGFDFETLIRELDIPELALLENYKRSDVSGDRKSVV